jgi:hypothetical protein
MEKKLVVNEKIQNLINALAALDLNIDVGRVHWADNTKGIVIHIGEYIDELIHDGKVIEEIIKVPVMSLSFTNEGKLKDIESIKSVIFMEEVEKNNVAILEKHNNHFLSESNET